NRTEPKSKEIAKGNVVERYGRRCQNRFLTKPQRAALKKMALAQYATYYDVRVTKSKVKPIDVDFAEDDFEQDEEVERT
ncbi:MAG: hypothetical protein GY740_02095, partial [Gammaproteobacteria bacterium]|nr:hypothetical protein [Gammaproteobacteria bacterium]